MGSLVTGLALLVLILVEVSKVSGIKTMAFPIGCDPQPEPCVEICNSEAANQAFLALHAIQRLERESCLVQSFREASKEFLDICKSTYDHLALEQSPYEYYASPLDFLDRKSNNLLSFIDFASCNPDVESIGSSPEEEDYKLSSDLAPTILPIGILVNKNLTSSSTITVTQLITVLVNEKTIINTATTIFENEIITETTTDTKTETETLTKTFTSTIKEVKEISQSVADTSLGTTSTEVNNSNEFGSLTSEVNPEIIVPVEIPGIESLSVNHVLTPAATETQSISNTTTATLERVRVKRSVETPIRNIKMAPGFDNIKPEPFLFCRSCSGRYLQKIWSLYAKKSQRLNKLSDFSFGLASKILSSLCRKIDENEIDAVNREVHKWINIIKRVNEVHEFRVINDIAVSTNYEKKDTFDHPVTVIFSSIIKNGSKTADFQPKHLSVIRNEAQNTEMVIKSETSSASRIGPLTILKIMKNEIFKIVEVVKPSELF